MFWSHILQSTHLSQCRSILNALRRRSLIIEHYALSSTIYTENNHWRKKNKKKKQSTSGRSLKFVESFFNSMNVVRHEFDIWLTNHTKKQAEATVRINSCRWIIGILHFHFYWTTLKPLISTCQQPTGFKPRGSIQLSSAVNFRNIP